MTPAELDLFAPQQNGGMLAQSRGVVNPLDGFFSQYIGVGCG
jgi:hypothetical protein